MHAKPPNRPCGITVRRHVLSGSRMTMISVSPLNPDHEIHAFYPDVSGVPRSQNTIQKFEGERDRHQVRFPEAIQTAVCSNPDIFFAVLKNCLGNIVAESILGCKRLDGGAEFLDSTLQ